MEKEILIKIKIDTERDEWGNVISVKGFDESKEVQKDIDLVGLLEIIKQQEIRRVLGKEVKK